MVPTLPLQPDPRQLENGAYPPVFPVHRTFGTFTSVLRRHRVLVGLCLALTLGAAGAYTALAPRVYEATSLLRFEVEQVNLPQLVRLLSTENLIGTEIEVLRGRQAAQAVIDSLGLRARLESPRRARTSELFSTLRVAGGVDTLTLVLHVDGDQLQLSRPGSREPEMSSTVRDTVRAWGVTLALTPTARELRELRLGVVSPEEAARSFESALKVSRPALGTDLIAVRVRSNDPIQAAATANLLAQQLILGRQSVQLARTGSTVRFLKQQLDTLGIQLRRAEEALRAYRERAGVVDVEEAARTQVRRLAQIEADRGAVEAERQALSSLVQQMRSDSAQPGKKALSRSLISFPTLFRNAAASELLGALAQVENQRSALLVRRTPDDPDVQVLTNRIRELDTQLQGIAETYLQGLTNQVAALQDVARGFGGALDSLPKKEVRTARLEREVKVQQELYTLLQTRLKEAEITRAMEDPSIRIADPAVVPERPVRPIAGLNLGLAVVLGSLLGMVGAYGREMADRSVRTRSDALLAAGLPVLGAAPRLQHGPIKLLPRPVNQRHVNHRRHTRLQQATRRLRGMFGRQRRSKRYAAARIKSLLVTRGETLAAYVEAFNHLHASLILAHQERPPKVLVFTSPLPGEGKTLSTINFALTLAGRGVRVLLIDADFRCGLVHEVFGYARQPGFAELLNGTARFDQAAQRISVGETGSLVMLPSGAQFLTAGKQLKPEMVREVLQGLASEFDLVLVDSPPVNVIADAAILGSAADGVILVARAGHTRVDALRYAMDQLTTARAPVLGTLLNDIDLRQRAYDDTAYHYLIEVERYYAGRA
jgi:capsular exopolysaccharide synthesis family protein